MQQWQKYFDDEIFLIYDSSVSSMNLAGNNLKHVDLTAVYASFLRLFTTYHVSLSVTSSHLTLQQQNPLSQQEHKWIMFQSHLQELTHIFGPNVCRMWNNLPNFKNQINNIDL